METEPLTWIGLDEAGRGPWAGPLAASAIAIGPEETLPDQTKDSKKLIALTRELLGHEIQSNFRHATVLIPVEEIDLHGIGVANALAFHRAYEKLLKNHPELKTTPKRVVIDGRPLSGTQIPEAEFHEKGEEKFPCIAAASILAKTARDKILRQLEAAHPGYGFSKHKGYGTQLHQKALAELGALEGIHRRSFRPLIPYFQKHGLHLQRRGIPSESP